MNPIYAAQYDSVYVRVDKTESSTGRALYPWRVTSEGATVATGTDYSATAAMGAAHATLEVEIRKKKEA